MPIDTITYDPAHPVAIIQANPGIYSGGYLVVAWAVRAEDEAILTASPIIVSHEGSRGLTDRGGHDLEW